MRDLVILGAGGHGRELLDIVEAVNAAAPTWRFLGFLDDGRPDASLLERRGVPWLGATSLLAELDADYAIGMGDGDARRRMDDLATSCGRRAAELIHPRAHVGSDVLLEPGVVLAVGASVTTNVRMGRHTHLNVAAQVAHDCRLGPFVTVSPGALVNGGNTVGSGVLLGAGSVVTPGRTIGADTWVGAGAVVVDDLPPRVVATGVPARIRRSR